MYLKRLKIGRKLALLVGVFVAGFLVFGLLSYVTLNVVKVNGPVYENIRNGKDVIGDVLPPPEYIVESYLTLMQLSTEANRDHRFELIARFKKLEAEFSDRHNYWSKTLPNGTLKDLLVEKSYRPAVEFYRIADDEYLPAIRIGNWVKASQLIQGSLGDQYSVHRAAIDEVIQRALQEN